MATFLAAHLSASFVQIHIEPGRNGNVDFRIERQLERLVDLIQRDRAHLALDPQAKEALLQNINMAIQTMIVDPGPGPGPNPFPVPPSYLSEVTAIVENYKLVLVGANSGEVFTACMNNYPTNLDSVDDILLVTDNSKTVRLYRQSGYYGNKGAVCSLISQNSNFATMSRQVGFITINGSLEQRNFTLTGETKAKILSQCFDAYVASGLSTSIDEIYLSVGNFPMERLYKPSGYWEQATTVCQQVMQVVDRVIP